jgi:chromosome segregation ATPase
MIDNNTSANPTLTFDQLQAIDVAQKTLANLQSEINNATKVLKGTKMECDRAVKNQAYNEELLGNLTTQVETKTKELADLKESITEKTAMLNELLSQFKEHTDLMTKGKADHDDRETKITKREQELNSKDSQLVKIQFALESEKSDFNSKVAKLKEVISTF